MHQHECRSPKEAAKKMIRAKVERGATLEQILGDLSYTAGTVCCGYDLARGDYVWPFGEPIKVSRDEVVVWRYRGEPCLFRYKIKDLYAEMREGVEQESLLGEVDAPA